MRQALEAAIDRAAINQVVFNGEFLPGNQWISPKNPYYQEKFPVPKRDVAKAKQLLQEAGLTAPVTVDFMVPNNPESRQVAEVIQAMAAEAGFDMKIRVTEFATSLKEARKAGIRPTSSAGRAASIRTATATSSTSARRRRTTAASATRTWIRWLDEARTKTALADRKAIYEKVAEKVLTEGGIIYLYHRLVIIAHTERVEGYKQLPDGLVRVVGVKLKQ